MQVTLNMQRKESSKTTSVTHVSHMAQLALNWLLLLCGLYLTVPQLFTGNHLVAMAVAGVSLVLLTPISLAVDLVTTRLFVKRTAP
jgi:hypothetical protein